MWNTELDEVLGHDDPLGVTGVKLKSTLTGETIELPIDGVFIAIGHTPQSDLFKGQIEMKTVWLHHHSSPLDRDERAWRVRRRRRCRRRLPPSGHRRGHGLHGGARRRALSRRHRARSPKPPSRRRAALCPRAPRRGKGEIALQSFPPRDIAKPRAVAIACGPLGATTPGTGGSGALLGARRGGLNLDDGHADWRGGFACCRLLLATPALRRLRAAIPSAGFENLEGDLRQGGTRRAASGHRRSRP